MTRTRRKRRLEQAGAGHDNLYYTGTPGARYNPAVGLGIPT
jgi:hypothetical protein